MRLGWVLAIMALAGCEGRQVVERSDLTPPAAAVPANASAQAGALLAAAARFETITRTAPSANQRQLDRAIADARAAAAGVRALLGQAATRLDGALAAMSQARDLGDRAGVALAAAEAYRALVSAGPLPSPARLMDYAGLRYLAGLKASPARWADMREAAQFAKTQWAGLDDQVADPTLAARLDLTLTQMIVAARDRDAGMAAMAAEAELDLSEQVAARLAGR
jgi:hypothetical protein